jgi:hypothetical protein
MLFCSAYLKSNITACLFSFVSFCALVVFLDSCGTLLRNKNVGPFIGGSA